MKKVTLKEAIDAGYRVKPTGDKKLGLLLYRKGKDALIFKSFSDLVEEIVSEMQ